MADRDALREEIARALHDANTGRICPDPDDPTRYGAMATAALEIVEREVLRLRAREQAAWALVGAGRHWVRAGSSWPHGELCRAIDEFERAAAGGSAEADESRCGNTEEGVGDRGADAARLATPGVGLGTCV